MPLYVVNTVCPECDHQFVDYMVDHIDKRIICECGHKIKLYAKMKTMLTTQDGSPYGE